MEEGLHHVLEIMGIFYKDLDDQDCLDIIQTVNSFGHDVKDESMMITEYFANQIVEYSLTKERIEELQMLNKLRFIEKL